MVMQVLPTQSHDVGAAPVASDQITADAGSARDEATEMQMSPNAS